jgi:hypothetical protein
MPAARPTSPPAVALLAVILLAGCSLAVPPSSSPTSTLPTPSPTAVPTATPTASPEPTASIGACDPAELAARITGWDGAAGSRFADVELTNAGTATCTVATMWQPQLVDGAGNVLIDGAAPTASDVLSVTAGAVLRAVVRTANYCGPDPLAPVGLAFVTSGGGGRVVAVPLSATDTSGVPPCLGPGSPGEIEMQPWAP